MATPDATSDDGGNGGGLFVHWATQPAMIPGNAQSDLTVEYVQLAFDNLRVIGDAGPGDPRTSQSGFVLQWSDGQAPDLISFPTAPSGLYSKVSLALDGHTLASSYRIRGHVTLNGTPWAYEIEDHNALTVSLDIDKTLSPGEAATVGLVLRVDHALDSIDFSTLPIDDGHLEFETSNSQMPMFRTKMLESFEVDDSGTY